MINSFEVAQMFAAQNQQFMQQNTFAHNIGIAPPQASLAGYGSISGPPQFAPGVPSAFSYAPTGFTGASFGPGNRAGAFGMGALASLPTIGGLGLGVMSGFKTFSGMAPFVDPVAGGIAGWARGGLMGAMGGAALPLGLGLAGGALASAMISPMITGGMQQHAVNAGMGQFNFLNSQSRTGMGFSRQDASTMGDQIRSMANIPEMLTSMEELTRLLPKLRQNGMMQGTRDITEFSHRFKEAIGTIKDLSRIFGTTLEDAEQFFSHSRSVGFFGKNDQVKNALNAQLTSGLSGMSSGQFMALQQSGANMAMAMGGNRNAGARAAGNIAQNLALAQNAGLIREGAIENETGELGPDAIKSMANKLTGLSLQLGNTSGGRLMMAGLSKFDSSGKFSGLDQDLLRRFNAGGVSMNELRRKGMSLTDSQKMSFTARQADIAGEVAAGTGPGGLASLLGDSLGVSGEKLNILLQRMGGMSSGEADIAMNMRGVRAGTAESLAIQRRSEEASMNDKSPDAIAKKIKTRIANMFTNPLQGSGAKLFNYVGKVYEEVIDDIVGRHTLTLSKNGERAFETALMGGSSRAIRDMNFRQIDVSGATRGIFSRLGDTDFASGLIGERTPVGENAHLDRLYRGTFGANVDGPAHRGAAPILNSIRASIEGYNDLPTAGRRNDALLNKLSKTLTIYGLDGLGSSRTTVDEARKLIGTRDISYAGKEAEALIRSGLEGQGVGKRSFLQNIIESEKFGAKSSMNNYDYKNTSGFLTAEASAGGLNSARDYFKGKLSPTTLALIENDKAALALVMKAAENPASVEGLMDKLSPAVRDAVNDARGYAHGLSTDGNTEFQSNLINLGMYRDYTDVEALKKNLSSVSVTFADQLGAATGTGLNDSQMGILKRVSSALKGAAADPAGGTPELRDALIAMADAGMKDKSILIGDIGANISNANLDVGRMRGKVSIQDLAAKYHIDAGLLKDKFKSDVVDFNNRTNKQTMVETLAGRGMFSSGASRDKDTSIISALQEITNVNKGLVTALATLEGKKDLLKGSKPDDAKADGSPAGN